MSLKTEIFEQPDVLQNLLDRQYRPVEKIASALRGREFQYIYLAARGTSDNAGRYADYLFGALNGIPIALATPSLFTIYQQPPSLKGALVVGISQSGQSPDIVSVVAEGNRQGCPTLAITNQPDSPLGMEAEFTIELQAGVEAAVAATKTYTAELMVVAMLSVALRGEAALQKALFGVPPMVRKALELDTSLAAMALDFRSMQRCVVLGRGYQYATAYEWALKMKELTYLLAEPYSTADFQHGPVAMVEKGFPVLAVATEGRAFSGMLDLIQSLKEKSDPTLLVISDRAEALELASYPVSLPPGIPEWLAPLVSIIPAQLFAYHLTVAKGLNTETPRTIHKVTETV
jgi:glutamine---fructose-6-phosphate transaminase (isomerizing)